LVGVEADGVLERCVWLPMEFFLHQLRPIEVFAQLLSVSSARDTIW